MNGRVIRRSPARQRHLVVMIRQPRAGRVKTRLARGIGHVAAVWWYRHQVARLIQRLDKPRRWTLWLAVTPDTAGLRSRDWPGHLRRVGQGRGDLGDRMGRLFRGLPPGKVVIVGSDVPGISPDDIGAAFGALGRRGAVIGPAEDGGYWLIGLRRGGQPVPAGLFRNVRWSSAHALRDTLKTLQEPDPVMLRRLRDVDSAEDLKNFLR